MFFFLTELKTPSSRCEIFYTQKQEANSSKGSKFTAKFLKVTKRNAIWIAKTHTYSAISKTDKHTSLNCNYCDLSMPSLLCSALGICLEIAGVILSLWEGFRMAEQMPLFSEIIPKLVFAL